MTGRLAHWLPKFLGAINIVYICIYKMSCLHIFCLTVTCCRFLYMSDCWGDTVGTVDNALTTYMKEYQAAEKARTFVDHLPAMPKNTAAEQFKLLSSIPNFHWWPKTRDKTKAHVGFPAHLLYDPTITTDSESQRRKYKPPSPRNLLMYLSSFEDTNSVVLENKVVSELLDADTYNPGQEEEMQLEEPVGPEPKRRKQSSRLVRVTPESLAAVYQVPLENCTPARLLYTGFVEQMISQGTIQWRYHQPRALEVVAMSDYNPSDGLLNPTSFVHVTCTYAESGALHMKCTCAIYQIIQGTVQVNEGQHPVLDDSFSCMHCRFFKEFLVGCVQLVESNNEETLTPIQLKVKQGLPNMLLPVLLLGSAQPNHTTKFSVKGIREVAMPTDANETYSILNVTFMNGECILRCLKGLCQVKMKNKMIVTDEQSLEKCRNFCSHLLSLCLDFETVKQALGPELFFQNLEEDALPAPPEDMNSDDLNIDPTPTDNRIDGFDTETGLWKFRAWSKHKPKEEYSDDLIRYLNMYS